MSDSKLISLFDDPGVLVATGKRIFSKEESGALLSLQETVQRVKALEESREEKLAQAESLAIKRGRGEGLEQGRQHARQELAEKLLEIERSNEEFRQSVRSEVATLALDIVRKIASGIAPDAMLAALATDAAAEHLPRQSVSLKVHPQNLQPVKARLENLNNSNNQSAAVIKHIVADSELNPTDCVLETTDGQVCADLETQLLSIEHHLCGPDTARRTVAGQP